MKIIHEEVITCAACPYCEINDDDNYSYPDMCTKFQISFHNWGTPGNFNIIKGIHPDCKLEDA